MRESLEQVRENLPPGFLAELPCVTGVDEPIPRVQGLVRVVLDQEMDHLDPAFLRRFVEAYQGVQPLTMGELWALPTIVRLLALEDLATYATALANACGGSGAPPDGPADLSHEQRLAACIRTLLTVKNQDWAAFFESLSLVHHRLSTDPVGAYRRMDFETRDRYRRAVEHFARRSGKSELEVAAAAIQQAQESTAVRQRHVGWSLVAEGRSALARRLELRPNVVARGAGVVAPLRPRGVDRPAGGERTPPPVRPWRVARGTGRRPGASGGVAPPGVRADPGHRRRARELGGHAARAADRVPQARSLDGPSARGADPRRGPLPAGRRGGGGRAAAAARDDLARKPGSPPLVSRSSRTSSTGRRSGGPRTPSWRTARGEAYARSTAATAWRTLRGSTSSCAAGSGATRRTGGWAGSGSGAS